MTLYVERGEKLVLGVLRTAELPEEGLEAVE